MTDISTLVLVALLQAALLVVAGVSEQTLARNNAEDIPTAKAAAVAASVLFLGVWQPAFTTIGISQDRDDGAKVD